jgi:autotransporter translocation and assembly factor TamB
MTGRRIAIALLVAGALGVAAVGASWLGVKLWGPAFTADRIAAAITEGSGRPARVESVVLEPLRGRVRVSGLTVGAADDGTGQPMVRVERIDVGIHLESFWRRELVIGIAADSAQVQLTPEPGSTQPFTFEMPERFQLGPITARLSSIRLERSRLRYEDAANGFTLALDGLAATGRPQGGGLELTGRVDTVNLRVGGVTEKLERLAIEGRVDATRVLVRRLEAGGDDRTLKVEGAIESPWTQPVLAAEATARLGLGPITRNLGSAVPVEGTAAIDLTLGGPLAAPVVSGRLHLERLDVADVNARDLSTSFTYDAQALTLPDLTGRLLGGTLRGSLTVPARTPHDALVRIHLANAEVAAVARLRGGTLDVRGRLTLDGEVRGDLSRPRSWQGQVRVDGSDVTLPGALARLGIGRVKAIARTNGGEVVSDVDASWPSANLTARARLDPDLRLRLQARAGADLSALPQWAGRAVDVQLSGDGTWPLVAGTAVVDLTRTGVRRDADRIDIRLTPVKGPTPRWSGSLQSQRVSLPWVEIEALQTAVALSTAALEVERLTARVAGVPVQGSGRWSWDGIGAARIVAGPTALGRLPGVTPDLALEGTGRAEIEAKASPTGIQATARVETERVAVSKITLGSGNGEAILRDRHLEASFRFPDRRLEMSARGDLAPGQVLQARVGLRALSLETLLAPARPGEAPLVRGTVSADADLAIAVDDPAHPRGTLKIEAGSFQVTGTAWTSPQPIMVRLDGRRATLDPLRLVGPGGIVTASGVIWDESAPSLVTVRLDQGRLAALAPALGLEGRIRIEGELSGDAGAVAGKRARARLDGEGLTLPGALAKLGAGTGRIELVLADETVRVERGEIAWPGLAGEVNGRVGLDGRLALDARATVHADRLGAALGGLDAGGTLTATATLGGRTNQLDGRVRMTSEGLVVSGIPIERLEASGRLQGDTARLERLTARVLGAPVRAQGEWTLGGDGRADLDAGPLALAQLTNVPPQLALDGSLSLHVEASTVRGGFKAFAQTRVRQARALGIVLGEGHLTARVEDRRLLADLSLAEGRITGAASGALAPGGLIDTKLELATLQLSPVLRHLVGDKAKELDADVTVAGRITARLPWDQPSALNAQGRFAPVVLRLPGRGIDSQGRIDGLWQNGVLTLERAELEGSTGFVRASGTVGPGGRLELTLDARTPLPVLLAPVAEVSAADGTVVVHSQVSGTLEAPVVRGEATLAKGSVVLRALPDPIRDINARVVATTNTIRVQEATATYGAGRLSATGEAAIAGRTLGGYRLRLTARDLPLRPFEGLDTIWNADLDLASLQGQPLLAGEARLVRGLYSRDLFTLSALTAPAPAPKAEGGAGLPLRIRVRLDDNMVVRTPQSRLIVGGTLNVQGTTTAPVVLGALEAREGTVLLRGNRYQIERAIVRFADPLRIDPLLDVAATTRIREYEVTMRVTGRVRDLDIRLSSSPPLPRDDLMSLVAFGNTRGEGAGGALAGEAARLVANELLDLSGNDRGPPGPLQTIMDRTRVSYTHNAEDIGRFGLRVEYELVGPFLVSAERTSLGYYAIDGVVRLRFR